MYYSNTGGPPMPRLDNTYHSADVFRYWLNLSVVEMAELLVLNTVGIAFALDQAGRIAPGISNIEQRVGNKMVLLYSGDFAVTITQAISSGFITLNSLTESEIANTFRGLSSRARTGYFRLIERNPF